MYGYIYVTTNSVNGKKYIGQKKSDIFLGSKYLGSGYLLIKAISKYGRDNFNVELLERVDGCKKDLDNREKFWIAEYHADKSEEFYNIQSGGQGGDQLKHLPEDRIKQIRKDHSEFMKSFKMSDEAKERLSKVRRGMKRSEQTKQNISKSLIGKTKKMPKSLGKKISARNTGRKWVSNGTDDKFIDSKQCAEYINNGWVYGRSKSKHRNRKTKHATTIESITTEKSCSE